MSEYEEYGWVQKAIDMTLLETEETKNLSEKLKESGKIKKDYYHFPEYMIKNPSAVFYVPLKSSDPENYYSLETMLSEN